MLAAASRILSLAVLILISNRQTGLSIIIKPVKFAKHDFNTDDITGTVSDTNMRPVNGFTLQSKTD